HLHLAQADGAARAPWHGIITSVDQTALVALLEEAPDGVVVFLRHREIASPLVGRRGPVLVPVPVHPIAEPYRLFGLDFGVLVHTVFAKLDKTVNARKTVAGHQVLDVALGAETELLFDLDLHPKALAIEAVLVAQVMARHGEVTLVGILIGAAPGVM